MHRICSPVHACSVRSNCCLHYLYIGKQGGGKIPSTTSAGGEEQLLLLLLLLLLRVLDGCKNNAAPPVTGAARCTKGSLRGGACNGLVERVDLRGIELLERLCRRRQGYQRGKPLQRIVKVRRGLHKSYWGQRS